ncbi:unnamed protein product [Notodromas monacha]|uniref:Uncharacterized protein n=1 Tax=Notodromas monacha TaxID=399045 RepID=A0A7R9BTN6_9CRUS|nr:unnamed protein product [Notodromas monacha]CAG0920152.1 unnamed protein product [Notodromas monacha]
MRTSFRATNDSSFPPTGGLVRFFRGLLISKETVRMPANREPDSVNSPSFNDSQSFQESGIFDGSCSISDAVSESTQTDDADVSDDCPKVDDVDTKTQQKRKKMKMMSKPKPVAVFKDESSSSCVDSHSSSGANDDEDDEECGVRVSVVKRLESEKARLAEEAESWKSRAETLARDVEVLSQKLRNLEFAEKSARQQIKALNLETSSSAMFEIP